MHKKAKDSPRPTTITGTIRVSQRGTGYFRLPITPKYPKSVDAEVSFDDLGTALHGDTVKVSIIGGKTRDGGPRAKVLQIIKRGKRGYAGELVKSGHELVLKATDPRMYTQISIPKKFICEAKVGDKIFVMLVKW